MKSRIFALLLGLFCTPLMADYRLEMIDLQSRPVEEMIPLLQPFVDQGGSITGRGYQLIVKTSPKNLAELKQMISQLDTPPRRLMIYVRQAGTQQNQYQQQQADINAMVGKHGKVVVGSRAPNDSIRYQIRDRNTQSKLDATHRVQTLEGRPAFIQTGQSVPIREQSTTVTGGVIHQQTTTRYRNATSGFYVTPRINGDQVLLDIAPNQERPGRIQGTYEIQAAHTTVSGRLGEWIPLGGVNQSQQGTGSDILRQSSTLNRNNSNIEVLVEEIH